MSIFTTVFAPIFGVLGLVGLASLLYPEFDGRISFGPLGALPAGSTLSADDKKKFRLIGAALLAMCVVLLVGGFMLNSGGGKKENNVEPTPDGGPVSTSPDVMSSETQTTSESPTPSPSPFESDTTSESRQPEKISLASLTPLYENANTEPTSLGGKEYLDLVREDPEKCGKQELIYNVGKKYTKFTATTGLYDDYDESDGPWIFAVYVNDGSGDRQLLKRIMKFGDVKPIDVSVKNAIRLKLVIQWIDPGRLITCSPLNSYAAVWANPTLSP
ncbi:NPCBM/NEW2 domain-containing protein [Streptomyces sp. NPDC051554]|uniref:NPCBM/NEW2 domain-containing protein n=1 Tax=Streptomyces sp. NPDC051554 TaxID=3365656 RepID=UPI0037BAAF60